MVELSFNTIRVVVDSLLVVWERVSCMDCNGDGVANLVEGFFQVMFIVRNRFMASDASHSLATVVTALSILVFIRIILLAHDPILCSVPSISHVPATAAAMSAIHKLLFADAQEFSNLFSPDALNSTSCRECPTAAAMALVLHFSDQAGLAVVEQVRATLSLRESLSFAFIKVNVSQSEVRHLLFSPVRSLVEREGEGFLRLHVVILH